jgi:hypothetical protein
MDCNDVASEFSDASPVERTIIMLMERVSRLEDRLAESETRHSQSEKRHHDLVAKTLMLMSGKLTMYLEVLMWASGVTETMRISWWNNDDMFREFVEKLGGLPPKAMSLYVKATGSNAYLNVPDGTTSVDFMMTLKHDIDFKVMIEDLTLEELDQFWEWRMVTAAWKNPKV